MSEFSNIRSRRPSRISNINFLKTEMTQADLRGRNWHEKFSSRPEGTPAERKKGNSRPPAEDYSLHEKAGGHPTGNTTAGFSSTSRRRKMKKMKTLPILLLILAFSAPGPALHAPPWGPPKTAMDGVPELVEEECAHGGPGSGGPGFPPGHRPVLEKHSRNFSR